MPFVCREPAQFRKDRKSWTGPEDCSFRFAVRRDDEFIYVAVEVTDDRTELIHRAMPWKQDGLVIRFDGRPESQRVNLKEKRKFKDFLMFALSPGETPDKMFFLSPGRLPKGSKGICARTDSGFNAEIAVPVSYLDGLQEGRWKTFRLNVAVTDLDEIGGKRAQIWWRPMWDTGANYDGSGTFRRP